MDPTLTAAAFALDAGDVLGALKRVALREDAPALALRGVALARLGKRERARELLRRAAKAFGARAPLGRARCRLAEAEIALASRDLRDVGARLALASRELRKLGDAVNALHADCLAARSLILRGRLLDAERVLVQLDARHAPAALRAEIYLTWGELQLKKPDTRAAGVALGKAERAATRARISAISQEVRAAKLLLEAPAARLLESGAQRVLDLAQVEALLVPAGLLIDARSFALRTGVRSVSLVRRPVLFSLARALADAWPAPATRHELLRRVFSATRPNDSHRARLRVEIARLRRALRQMASIAATPDGFRLTPLTSGAVRVLAPLVESDHGALLTLLGDGEAWSSSALAIALGVSQRSVQRSLTALESAAKAQASGRARAKRWHLAPGAEFATPLLLPGALEFA